MVQAINWGLVLIAGAVGSVLGYYWARTKVWWTKKKMGFSLIGDVLKYGAATILVLMLIGAVGLRSLGWL